jgi:hypothetical protein
MKRIITTLLILSSIVSGAQSWQPLTNPGNTGLIRGANVTEGLQFYKFNDTLPVPIWANSWWAIARKGDSIYWYSPATHSYKLFGGGGAVTWGSITGTLSAQTDLQNALQPEAKQTHAGNDLTVLRWYADTTELHDCRTNGYQHVNDCA